MPRRPLRALLAAVCAAALAGCAAVPASSDLHVVRSMPAGSRLVPPAGPERGVDPFRLVGEYIEATDSPANEHAAARLVDHVHGAFQLPAAVTPLRVEHVASEAFRVHAHQNLSLIPI